MVILGVFLIVFFYFFTVLFIFMLGLLVRRVGEWWESLHLIHTEFDFGDQYQKLLYKKVCWMDGWVDDGWVGG